MMMLITDLRSTFGGEDICFTACAASKMKMMMMMMNEANENSSAKYAGRSTFLAQQFVNMSIEHISLSQANRKECLQKNELG